MLCLNGLLSNNIPLICPCGQHFESAVSSYYTAIIYPQLYNNLLKGGKPVFGVEYNDNNGRVCSEAKKYGIITKYRSNGWHDCW
jgi:hypothetical protein